METAVIEVGPPRRNKGGKLAAHENAVNQHIIIPDIDDAVTGQFSASMIAAAVCRADIDAFAKITVLIIAAWVRNPNGIERVGCGFKGSLRRSLASGGGGLRHKQFNLNFGIKDHLIHIIG